MANWRVTGTKRGKPVTVTIEADTHGDAVRIASTRRGLLLVVRGAVLIESEAQRAEARRKVQRFARA
jgi:hypothetical protein